MLSLFAKQLHEGGYRHMMAASLKPKHVDHLLDRWKSESLSAGTLKNRVANLRWWAEKIGKPNVVARNNDTLGIERRQFVTNTDKGKDLTAQQLAGVTCDYTRLSLRLEAAFGLRREESLKIQPAWADRGTVLRLKDSWTKGGRPRDIPIATEAQRALLDEAKRFAGQGSLIPEGRLYRDQLKTFRAQCERVGLHGVHGLRHRYAQQRYLEKTGWACPAVGGPSRRALSAEQREVDTRVRLEISAELGHARLQVVAIYLGS
jgi:integrase